jgi:hypothetical protein
MKLDLKTILIIVLGSLLLLTQMCSGNRDKPGDTINVGGKNYQVLKHTVDTEYVPVEKIVIKRGKDIYHDTTIYVPLPASFDTMEMVKNYLAMNVFKDSLILDDSLGFIVVSDTIQMNKIRTRVWDTKINKVKIRDNKIVTELPKNQVFIGFNTSVNKVDMIGSVGIGTTLKTKSDKLYNLNLGLMNTSNGMSPYIGGGLQWKIRLKK